MYLDKCVNYFKTPVLAGDNRYIYLYETVNKCNGNIYIGCRIYRGKNPYEDTYIGNGCKILKDGRLYKRRGKETNFRRALSKFGFLNFEKTILCFFDNIDDALKSETNIVNEKFLERPDVLNMVIGGGCPPVGEGENNNNYGRHWTEEMKLKLSRKRRKNGKSKGSKNPKAITAFAYDLLEEKWIKLEYLHQLKEIDSSLEGIGLNKIRKFRWLIVPDKMKKNEISDYVHENLKEKYQKTFDIITLLKKGKTEEEIVLLGHYRAHIRRIILKYGKNYKP